MSSRKKTTSSLTIIFLAVIVLLGIIYTATGTDLLGIFTVSPTALSPTTTFTLEAPTSTTGPIQPGITPSVQIPSWSEIYFTDPLTIKDPANYAGSIEEFLIEKINAAQTSIHIASFEFDLMPVAEALVAAHNRGVDVRWVTDDENGLEADGDPGGGQFAMLTAAGIEVKADNRTALMHDKFWIFDGAIVWTGSTNITVNGIFKQDNNAIVVHSPEVAAMYEREFQEMWDGKFGPRSPSTVDLQSTTLDGTPILVLFSSEDEVVAHIITYVQNAQTSIRFLAFSFTDFPLADAMRQRAAAGVSVSGVFETVGSDGQGAEFGTLFCAGIPVRQDGNPQFMHNKLIIIDNRIVITGSLNFSSSADDANDENVIIVDNPDIAALYLQDFERIYALGHDPDPAKFPCP